METTKKVTVAIAGLGSRGYDTYAKYLKNMTDIAEITAVAEPRDDRRKEAAQSLGLPSDACFKTAEEMLERERLADVMLICTLDGQHEHQAVAALKKGYHLLLEKPIAPTVEGCRNIEQAALKYEREVAVCHVLRYTPFYQKIKAILKEGTIGDIVHIQAVEHVGYWHQAHSFVRGNWRNSEETSPMILQKCCHDLDLLFWLTQKNYTKLSSYGGLYLFKEENAPAGSTLRCTDDCAVKQACPYNAVDYYMKQLREGKTEWPLNVVCGTYPTEEKIMEALIHGPYGRCVYRCDNNVVDHQVVNLELEGGATASLAMYAFTDKCYRTIEIGGTKGEIIGNMDKNEITVNRFKGGSEVIDVSRLADDFSGHGGGDARMLKEFFEYLSGRTKKSDTLTSIERSMQSHYAAFEAEASRLRQM